jgi:iron complex transport system substrate-binding protein
MASVTARTDSLVVALVAAACAHAAVSVTDDKARPIALEKPAARIVSLAPHATEAPLRRGSRRARRRRAVDVDWPPEAASKPKVGDAHRLDMERIVTARSGPRRHVALFGARGRSRRCVREACRFHHASDDDRGIAADIERLGVLAGTQSAAAERRPLHFARSLERLSLRGRSSRKIRVFLPRSGTSRSIRSAASI